MEADVNLQKSDFYEDKSKHETEILKLNSTKAKKILSWKPRFNLKKAVKETALWYKEYYSNSPHLVDFSLNQIKNYFDDAKEGKK